MLPQFLPAVNRASLPARLPVGGRGGPDGLAALLRD